MVRPVGTGGSSHLHVELDTDTEHPEFSPTLSRSSNILKKGTDSTINSMDVFKVDATGQRGYKQTFNHAIASGPWVQPNDKKTFGLDGKVIKSKGI